jgi:hypothetical protein
MVKLAYDAAGRIGRGEEKTIDLRFVNGKLQQKWIVSTITPQTPLTVVEEWRDVPDEGEKDI